MSSGEQIRKDTSDEFTNAVNLSFFSIATYGSEEVQRMYQALRANLPLDADEAREFLPPIESDLIVALNSIHALVLARKDAAGATSNERLPTPDITAPMEVVKEVLEAQRGISRRTGGLYKLRDRNSK